MTNVKWHIFFTVLLIFFPYKKEKISVTTSHNPQHQIPVFTRPTGNGCFHPEWFKFHKNKSVIIERLQRSGGGGVVCGFCWIFFFLLSVVPSVAEELFSCVI